MPTTCQLFTIFTIYTCHLLKPSLPCGEVVTSLPHSLKLQILLSLSPVAQYFNPLPPLTNYFVPKGWKQNRFQQETKFWLFFIHISLFCVLKAGAKYCLWDIKDVDNKNTLLCRGFGKRLKYRENSFLHSSLKNTLLCRAGAEYGLSLSWSLLVASCMAFVMLEASARLVVFSKAYFWMQTWKKRRK